MLSQGAVHLRAEARRTRKREKERSREVGALLRLKLGDRVQVQPQTTLSSTSSGDDVSAGPRRMISNLSQLVARMIFRRHETFRPLANRKTGVVAPRDGYVASPLSRSSAGV